MANNTNKRECTGWVHVLKSHKLTALVSGTGSNKYKRWHCASWQGHGTHSIACTAWGSALADWNTCSMTCLMYMHHVPVAHVHMGWVRLCLFMHVH